MTPSTPHRFQSSTIIFPRRIIVLFPVLCLSGCAMRQAHFQSPEQARDELVAAVRAGDSDKLSHILGPESDEILSSGDAVADRQAHEKFIQRFDEKNVLEPEAKNRITLDIGRDDWPMPIPIVKRGGSWYFDTPAGKDEILNRRIGRNELSTIQVCLAVVDAQKEYFKMDRDGDQVREYAHKFISDEGQKNGLYWKTSDGDPPSPLGELAAEAAEEGYGKTKSVSGERRPYHGYFYKLMTTQGSNAAGGARNYLKNGNLTEGFAVVAWPAEYGNSGIMTFLVNQNGVVFQRDLGRKTASIASTMEEFDPDSRWAMVVSELAASE